jgi:hypothetical protein
MNNSIKENKKIWLPVSDLDQRKVEYLVKQDFEKIVRLFGIYADFDVKSQLFVFVYLKMDILIVLRFEKIKGRSDYGTYATIRDRGLNEKEVNLGQFNIDRLIKFCQNTEKRAMEKSIKDEEDDNYALIEDMYPIR